VAGSRPPPLRWGLVSNKLAVVTGGLRDIIPFKVGGEEPEIESPSEPGRKFRLSSLAFRIESRWKYLNNKKYILDFTNDSVKTFKMKMDYFFRLTVTILSPVVVFQILRTPERQTEAMIFPSLPMHSTSCPCPSRTNGTASKTTWSTKT
jgi:hypothetical protein